MKTYPSIMPKVRRRQVSPEREEVKSRKGDNKENNGEAAKLRFELKQAQEVLGLKNGDIRALESQMEA